MEWSVGYWVERMGDMTDVGRFWGRVKKVFFFSGESTICVCKTLIGSREKNKAIPKGLHSFPLAQIHITEHINQCSSERIACLYSRSTVIYML